MSYAPAATSYCRTTSGVDVSRGEPVVPAKPEIRYLKNDLGTIQRTSRWPVHLDFTPDGRPIYWQGEDPRITIHYFE